MVKSLILQCCYQYNKPLFDTSDTDSFTLLSFNLFFREKYIQLQYFRKTNISLRNHCVFDLFEHQHNAILRK